mgnify:CR=1 FL=1
MLEFYQILGYVIVFAGNFRFADFIRFVFGYRIGAINLLKKFLSGKRKTSILIDFPKDYQEVLNSQTHLSMEDMALSSRNWKAVQSAEKKYAKENQPQLFIEQMPL